MKKPYTKPPLTYAKQVQLLKKRGLFFGDIKAAAHFLEHTSYYRFSAYCIPFQNQRDVFIPGTRFRQITRLYVLDESLRMAVLKALTPIEIYLRARIIYQLSHKWGPFCHHSRKLFRKNFNHQEWLDSLKEDIRRARETFIGHFKKKYRGFPRLPLWMACEVMSLGNLSRLYSGLLPEPQRSISSIFEIHHSVLKNWLHFITYLRNVCAHHGRLWNRKLPIRPDIPRKKEEWRIVTIDNTRVYAATVVLEWLNLKAGLPSSIISDIHDVMQEIEKENKRFKEMMGIKQGNKITLHWN